MFHLAVLFLIIFPTTGFCGRSFEVKMYTTTCLQITEVSELFQCDFFSNSPGVYYFSNSYKFSKTFSRNDDLGIRFYVDIQQKFSKASIRVLDIKFNFCRDLPTLTRNSLLRQLITDMHTASTLLIICPLNAGELYKLQNLTISGKNFPVYTPELNFTAVTEYFSAATVIAKQITTGGTVPRRIRGYLKL